MSYNSPYCVHMRFDLTDPEGRAAFEYARLGEKTHLCLIEVLEKMRSCVKYQDAPRMPELNIRCVEDMLADAVTETTTQHWRDRISDLMDDYGVPWEV